jgi:hypothetical protein
MKPYIVEDRVNTVAPHHASIKALWETKWRWPVSLMMRVSSQNTHISQCSIGIYPFMEAKVGDFDKVFSKLIEVC